MVLTMNKKGVFFIILTIILLAIFIVSVTVISEVSNRKSIQKRVETLSQFVTATEEDLERQLFIFGFRVIYYMEEDIASSYTPIADVNHTFQEAFFNGTYKGEEKEYLIDANLNYFLNSTIRPNARRVSADINITNATLIVRHLDPWNIRLVLSTNLFASDEKELATWNKTLVTIADVPIAGFADPLHVLGTNGEKIVNITQTPYESFDASDTTNTSLHISGNFFKASTSAPNFLMRFEGDFSPDENGIESFVNLATLPQAYVQEKSVVDYIYFDLSNNPEYCRTDPSLFSWFKVDQTHATNYGLDWPVSGCPEGGS